MKFVVVGLLALVGFAGVSRADGLEDAEKVCSGLLYSNEKRDCLAVVQKAKSLDEQAVKICGDLLYAKEKIECLASIQDLKFTATSIGICKDELYAKDKIACLKKSGRVVEGSKKNEEVDKAYIRSSLRKALRALQDDDDRKAEQIIENLIDTL